jgi:hypothetical protein
LQEELPDSLLSNHDAFFMKLNLAPPQSAAAASTPTSAPVVAPVISPKLASKKAPLKGPVVGSPLCSPLSTPRLKALAASAAAASEEASTLNDLKPETKIDWVGAANEEAASSMDMLCHSPPIASSDMLPPSVEAQD